MTIRTWTVLPAILCAASVCTAERSKMELPSIFSDNMILQRDCEAAVWGWDKPGQEVSVSFRGKTAEALAGENGAWKLKITTGDAAENEILAIRGSENCEIRNVAVGEVWIAGGQSNMWWQCSKSKGYGEFKNQMNDPSLRIWDANTAPGEAGYAADARQCTVNAKWDLTTPQSVGDFPATAFFFARGLREQLKVPVGIVHLAVPGVAVQRFIPANFADAHFQDELLRIAQETKAYPEKLAAYEKNMKEWEKTAEKAKSDGEKAPETPKKPENPENWRFGTLFNGTVAPAVPYTAKGFVWWQGEGNAYDPQSYAKLFPGLIESWRQEWGSPEMPFLFVELHNFGPKQKKPSEEDPWPFLRNAQQAALSLKNVWEVSVIDIKEDSEGDWQIHPHRKQLAGERLFLCAMDKVYRDKIFARSCPRIISANLADGGALLVLNDDAVGIRTRDGGQIAGFALAGRDKIFYWADNVKIDGTKIYLSSEKVPEPLAVRYSFANHPIGNLVNPAGLPLLTYSAEK